jgi:mono/diheme cytochrome c family protein
MRRVASMLLAFAGGACQDGHVDLERMIDQRKFEAYEACTTFVDGKVMRAPPPGSVPHSGISSRDRLSTGLEDGKELVELPLPITRQLLSRGQNRFDIYCATCHGALGDGQSQVAENMRLRSPPSLHEERLRALPPGHLFSVIKNGYGLMPAYGSALSVSDRWAVVAYVGALQLSQSAELARLPAPLREEAAPWLK